MFLFILESIGTSELVLIAGVALIVFGPRKLPQMAKTIAKTMAEFRNATNEFKSTWEKEANFEEPIKKISPLPETQNAIARVNDSNDLSSQTNDEVSFPSPTIRELSASDIAERFPDADKHNLITKAQKKIAEKTTSAKQDWL